MHRNDSVLESFLSGLPRDLRHVFEFRHQSWFEAEVFRILRRYNAGLCVFDMPSFSSPLIATADFAYVRFHGSTGLYSSYYSDEELAGWAGRLAYLAAGLEAVYVYFNNDVGGAAVDNAMALRKLLKI